MARSQPPRSFTTLLALGGLAGIFGLALWATPAAQAQTYKVLHNFSNGSDGGTPESTLAIDRAGNLYGTASEGGTAGFGTVFKLPRYGSTYIFNPLYNFQGQYDGGAPLGPVTLAADGTLYGTTLEGGTAECQCGVVYRLTPPPTTPPSPFVPWHESVVHAFEGPEGAQPVWPQLIFDDSGNIYGTTQFGGGGVGGAVFELTPSGGNWSASLLFGFPTIDAGQQPMSGVVMDSAGNLYGTTGDGGAHGNGVVYELSPTANGWQQTILHAFDQTDGSLSYGGLIMDQAGNLYGGTSDGGAGGCGVIYELSPSNGGFNFQILANLRSSCGGGPYETLTLDAAGNLYGAAHGDGPNGAGMVFKLTNSNGTWTLTDLHDFDFDTAYFPYGGVTLDANGNLFGTASGGGVYGHGVVWEITP